MPNAINPTVISTSSNDALNPEVIDPRMADIEELARWLDYAFTLPGGFRFGFAGFIGLIPGIGDVIDALISLYIIFRANQLGASRVTLARMLVNVGIEALAGAVPFAGTVFDMAFKANRRNYLLLKRHLAEPNRRRTQDTMFLAITVMVVAAALALPVLGLIELIRLMLYYRI